MPMRFAAAFARLLPALLITAALESRGAEPPVGDLLVGEPLRRVLADPISVSWSGRMLRDALQSLGRTTHVSVVLDRRVDPNRLVEWSAAELPLRRLVEELAARHECGVVWIGPTAYVAPTAAAAVLPQVIAERNAEIARMPADLQTALAARRSLHWDDLDEPRRVLDQLAGEARLRWTNLDVLPHDLLHGIATPPLSLVERLSLVTAGFGLTYHINAATRTIELRTWSTPLAASPPPKSPAPSVRAAAVPGTQVHTLRIKDVPLSKLVEVLRDKHGLKIRFDDAAILQAGLSIDRLTAVNVEQATLEALLEQAAAPLGLTAKRVGDTVEIGPRK